MIYLYGFITYLIVGFIFASCIIVFEDRDGDDTVGDLFFLWAIWPLIIVFVVGRILSKIPKSYVALLVSAKKKRMSKKETRKEITA